MDQNVPNESFKVFAKSVYRRASSIEIFKKQEIETLIKMVDAAGDAFPYTMVLFEDSRQMILEHPINMEFNIKPEMFSNAITQVYQIVKVLPTCICEVVTFYETKKDVPEDWNMDDIVYNKPDLVAEYGIRSLLGMCFATCEDHQFRFFELSRNGKKVNANGKIIYNTVMTEVHDVTLFQGLKSTWHSEYLKILREKHLFNNN